VLDENGECGMKIGDTIHAPTEENPHRTGTVIFVQPLHYTLEFTGRTGEKYRESFYCKISPDKSAKILEQRDKEEAQKKPPVFWGKGRNTYWSAEEDNYIIQGLPTRKIMELTGRTKNSIDGHRQFMREKGLIDCRTA
jgi:hypothetical protein